MKKRDRNILKNAGVLLVAMAMVLSVMPAVMANTEKTVILTNGEEPNQLSTGMRRKVALASEGDSFFSPGTVIGAKKLNDESLDGGVGADAWLGYTDGHTENALRWTDYSPWTEAIELTDPELASYRGQTICEIRVSCGCDVYGFYACPYEVYVDDYLGNINTYTLRASGTTSGIGWDTIPLPIPYTIPATGSVYVIVRWDNYPTDSYPAGFDTDVVPADDRGAWMLDVGSDDSWITLDSMGYDDVWGLEAGVCLDGEVEEDCIPDACDFALDGFSNAFMEQAIFDEETGTYYFNSLPKTLNISIANLGEIGIAHMKLMANVYKKVCGPTTEWEPPKYNLQDFPCCGAYPIFFPPDVDPLEQWWAEDELFPDAPCDRDSWVLQGGPGNRWLTNNQAWRCTMGEDRTFGADEDVYLGKCDDPDAVNRHDNLTTPAFDVTEAACATFSFSYWCEGEWTTDEDGNIIPVDYGSIAYSMDNGNTWTEVSTTDFVAYDTDGAWLDATLRFLNSGVYEDTQEEWEHSYHIICDDCEPQEGEIVIVEEFPDVAQLRIRFIWQKDPCLQKEGLYIDNVKFTRTEDYYLELVHQTHTKHFQMEGCDPEVGVQWTYFEFPLDFDPEHCVWYYVHIIGQVFDPDDCEADIENNEFKFQFKCKDLHDLACVNMVLETPEDGTCAPGEPATVNMTAENLGTFAESNVPVELLACNKVFHAVWDDDFETDTVGGYDLYYFIPSSGEVPFRWTKGDTGISDIYTNDPAQARSVAPGDESLICARQGTLPYIEEDIACMLANPATIDLDLDDNKERTFGDPVEATFSFYAKWSLELDAGEVGSLAYAVILWQEGPASGWASFISYIPSPNSAAGSWQNDWDYVDIDLWSTAESAVASLESSVGELDRIPKFQLGFVVFTVGKNTDTWLDPFGLPADPDGGCGNPYNPVPWSGFMWDRIDVNLVSCDMTSCKKVDETTISQIQQGETVDGIMMTWSETELCNYCLVGDINLPGDINPENDRCYVQLRVTEELRPCVEHYTQDLTTGGDCRWTICCTREGYDDCYAWAGIEEEHWAHYVNDMDDWMISPPLDLEPHKANGVNLNFTTWYEFQPGDFGEVLVRKNAGDSWSVLKKFEHSSGFKDVGCYIAEEKCSKGTQIAFRMYSNDEDMDEGWHIDDVYLINITGGVAGGVGADEYIGYNDGYTENSLGLDIGGSITMAIELTDTELSGHRDKVVDDICVSIGCDAFGPHSGISYEVWILEGALPANPDDIYSLPPENIVATGTSTTDVWHTIDVDDYDIPDSGSIFVGVNYLGTVAGEYPCGMDESSTTPDRGGIVTYQGYGLWSFLGGIGFPAVWGLDVGVTLGAADLDFGDKLPVMPWTPDDITEDFERENIAPWTCEPGTGGDYWMKWIDEDDTSTLPHAEEGYENYEDHPCCPCTLGWFVIPSKELYPGGYGPDGTGINDALAFEVNLTDPIITYAKLSCAMDFEFQSEQAYIEFSPDWEPGMDMRDATWVTYWNNNDLKDSTLKDGDGDGWTLLDELVDDDRFVLEEYLGEKVYLRFRLTTPGNGEPIGKGWAIDGLKLEIKRMGEALPEDTEPPVTELCFDSETSQVFLLATDYPLHKNCGIKETWYKLDGGANTDYIGPFTIGEGPHTVEYWSVDNCDNIESPHKTATLLVDTTAPTVELILPKEGWLHLFGSPIIDRILSEQTLCIGKVIIEATADDGTGSGVAHVIFDINDDTGYASAAPYKYIYNERHFGELTIQVRAVDNKGLVSDPAEMTVKVYSLGLF